MWLDASVLLFLGLTRGYVAHEVVAEAVAAYQVVSCRINDSSGREQSNVFGCSRRRAWHKHGIGYGRYG
jgi:hypothetical protein